MKNGKQKLNTSLTSRALARPRATTTAKQIEIPTWFWDDPTGPHVPKIPHAAGE